MPPPKSPPDWQLPPPHLIPCFGRQPLCRLFGLAHPGSRFYAALTQRARRAPDPELVSGSA